MQMSAATGSYAVAWSGSPTYCCVPRSIRLQPYAANGTAQGGNCRQRSP